MPEIHPRQASVFVPSNKSRQAAEGPASRLPAKLLAPKHPTAIKAAATVRAA